MKRRWLIVGVAVVLAVGSAAGTELGVDGQLVRTIKTPSPDSAFIAKSIAEGEKEKSNCRWAVNDTPRAVSGTVTLQLHCPLWDDYCPECRVASQSNAH